MEEDNALLGGEVLTFDQRNDDQVRALPQGPACRGSGGDLGGVDV